jgi:hypothetical protein
VGAAVVGYLIRQENRRYQEPLQQWANQNGWVLTLRPRPDWYRRLPAGSVLLALSGMVRGRPVSVAQYRTFSYGMFVTYQDWVVVVVWLDRSYPSIAVKSRGALSRLRRTSSGGPQATTGDDEFDHQFKVVTDDRAAARSLIGRQLIAAHLAGTVPTWSLAGHELLTYRWGRIDAAGQIPALAEPLTQVADLLTRAEPDMP